MPLIPSQQVSFSATRTELICQLFITAIEAESIGPSNSPQPCWQAYSGPERFIPSSRTVCPRPLTRWLARTPIQGAAKALSVTAVIRTQSAARAVNSTEGRRARTARFSLTAAPGDLDFPRGRDRREELDQEDEARTWVAG